MIASTPHLEAETGKFAVVLLTGDSVPHIYTHSSYTELGVYTPHLNYVSGKVALILPTGDVSMSEGSHVLSYPLGVSVKKISQVEPNKKINVIEKSRTLPWRTPRLGLTSSLSTTHLTTHTGGFALQDG